MPLPRYPVFVCAFIAISFATVSGGDVSEAAEGTSATEHQALAKRAAVLASKLGDASFQVRRDASRELLQIGQPALDVLLQAAKNDDPEVRDRARRLHREVRVEVHARRLERFLADPKSVPADSLSGMQYFLKIVGDGEEERQLFVDMHRAEAELFLMLDGDIKKFEDEYEIRAQEVRYLLSTPAARKKIPVTVSALMFLGMQPNVSISDRAAASVIGLANYNEFRGAITGSKSAVRRLVGHWISTDKSGATLQRLMLALRHNLEEGITPALAALKTPATPYELQYALLTVARFGGREHLPEIEKLFQNRTAITRVRRAGKKVQFSSEVRDVALAVAIHLTGQNAKADFGFPRISKSTQYVFNPNTAGFSDDATRAAAFKKWAEWQAKQNADEAVNTPEKSPAGNE